MDEIPAELVEAIGERAAAGRRPGQLPAAGALAAPGRRRGLGRPPGAGRGGRAAGPVSARTRQPTGAEALSLRLGDDVRHATYGEGVIVDIVGQGEKAEARVRFPGLGEKTFLLAWTPLQKV